MIQAERLRYYFKHTFGAEGMLCSAAGAGISQWENTPSEWDKVRKDTPRALETVMRNTSCEKR